VPSLLVLLRHAESTKNTISRFSTTDGQESLTDAGREQTVVIARALSSQLREVDSASIGFFSPPTQRSLATANVLSGDASVTIIDDLAPIRSPHPGLTEVEVARRDPEFFRLLTDYRNGLRSAYDIPRASGERVLDFEQRVSRAIDFALGEGHQMTVVVGHRSTLTATLLRAARLLTGYPQGWYGHVSMPLCSVSTIELTDDLTFSSFGTICDVSYLFPQGGSS
jgi:broad specificity phosphatase PhoE